MTAESTRARSRSYPAISLREAVERCRLLYEKDGWSEIPAEAAAEHWGFSGLNGGSRSVLAALRQYGLLEYSGSGDNLRVRLSDLAKTVLRPIDPSERAKALTEAMMSPKLFASIASKYPEWRLPSDLTLSAILERDEGIQPKAVKNLMNELRDSVEFLNEQTGRSQTGRSEIPTEGSGICAGANTVSESNMEAAHHSRIDSQHYPMPGGDAYVSLPKAMSREEAQRAKRWIERVIIPAIELAGDLEAQD